MGPATIHTQPEPWMAMAVWKMRLRNAVREPKSSMILVLRKVGITGSATPRD